MSDIDEINRRSMERREAKIISEQAARIQQLEAEGDKARARADKYRMALEDIAGLGVVCASDMALVALRGERHE